jgi:hypothetical protein
MKKILLIVLVICFGGLGNIFNPAFALSEVSLDKMPKAQIEVSKEPKVIKGSLLISDDQMLDELIQLQKKKDLEDIENLWKGKIRQPLQNKYQTDDSQEFAHKVGNQEKSGRGNQGRMVTDGRRGKMLYPFSFSLFPFILFGRPRNIDRRAASPGAVPGIHRRQGERVSGRSPRPQVDPRQGPADFRRLTMGTDRGHLVIRADGQQFKRFITVIANKFVNGHDETPKNGINL